MATPIGMLMKKIQCQLIAWVSTPPASRPIVPPAEATKPYTPIAFACSRGSGNIVTIMPEHDRRGHGAADALDEARRHEHLLALREPAEQRGDREERPGPAMKTFLRPIRSPKRPESSSSPPKLIR